MIIAKKLMLYLFVTKDKTLLNKKVDQFYFEYVNCLISIEINSDNELEIYANQHGVEYLLGVLEKPGSYPGAYHIFLSPKKEYLYGSYEICTPFALGSMKNLQVTWTVINYYPTMP